MSTELDQKPTQLSVLEQIAENTKRVTLATDGPGVTSLSSIDNKTPALVSGAGPVIATPRICLGTHHPATCGTGQCSNQAHGLCQRTSCAMRGEPER